MSQAAACVYLVYPQMTLARTDVAQQMTLDQCTPAKQILMWLLVRCKIALLSNEYIFWWEHDLPMKVD